MEQILDAFLQWLTSNAIAATVVTISISALVVGIVLIYIIAFIQGRQISFWPPSIGEKPANKSKSNNTSPADTSKTNTKNSNTTLEKEIAQLKKDIDKKQAQLGYIRSLHKTKYKLDYWRLTYTIDNKGGVHTKEEMSVLPLEDGQICYFRQIILGISPTVKSEITVQNLQAVNVSTKQRLEIIEISKDAKRHVYAVILDPPATSEKPTEIMIESYRPKVFDPLISNMQDQGSIRIVATSTSEVEVKFIAPPNLEFTSFSVSPDTGLRSFEKIGNLSCVIWHAKNLPNRTYQYTIQAISVKPK